MTKNFIIQRRSIGNGIWYTPAGMREGSDSAEELRQALKRFADRSTLSFAIHFRIITCDGDPVERYTARPGRLRKTWRKK